MPEILTGFPPVARSSARILILGSMPGKKSLNEAQYYAHPRNAFWKIIAACFAIPTEMPYEERCRLLALNDVALWDVIDRCERDGSLDSAIRPATLEPNDFVGFFQRHPDIGHVYFNGAKAEAVFNRRILPTIKLRYPSLRYHRLPSTSPAYASLSFEEKLQAWRVIATPLRTSH